MKSLNINRQIFLELLALLRLSTGSRRLRSPGAIRQHQQGIAF